MFASRTIVQRPAWGWDVARHLIARLDALTRLKPALVGPRHSWPAAQACDEIIDLGDRLLRDIGLCRLDGETAAGGMLSGAGAFSGLFCDPLQRCTDRRLRATEIDPED